ncbi:bifunctional 2-C-methyl-D-erythritol 4-phosphate cytidylyltransferase/2-C-methyl-D-erythritol 2,4-cyclodiphosphate synthase [Helicobacter pametensis]|uniref:bifunctional 2-C-methyl-D-erythritol 4-phosphate cytidylyltransferase/2-C-methyl-D-erythritol 2,4-cyclodiphosphate synthase n=1 Tax=Helicobacter pametensis TaxID=95149 RepID=UPI00055335D1|nr:bifunctional 2-C-methyl-D-erythritol 4-phosphate cytidylyltransferase/2-C-methyl-D-erythritol 2,4-cyclodiphosphate synthase [Helicobacter pametensis]
MDYIAQFKKEVTLILLSAGDSVRFSQDKLPKKQWLRIGNLPLWRYLVDVFRGFGFDQIFVMVSRDEYFYAQNFYENVFEGGQSRTQSILNALKLVQTEYVMFHDVARFHPQNDVIQALLEKGYRHRDLACIAPRMRVADTLYCEDGSYPKREDYWMIQTPQLSKASLLHQAMSRGEFSDESSAMSAFGKSVAYVEGSSLLHKLTYSSDLFFVAQTLPLASDETFVGGGVDIHGFEEGKQMVLCGVEIEDPRGFEAHSDGDVGIHSVIDACLGAIGGGDIGEWFPDHDMQYHQADSKILLQKIGKFINDVGYEVINLDLTILAQSPKISPYKQQMREKLASLLKIALHQVNIKATTGEGIGFVGREEGVCVLSHVSLRFKRWNEK